MKSNLQTPKGAIFSVDYTKSSSMYGIEIGTN